MTQQTKFFGLAGPIITALIAIAGWVFSISNTTAVNSQRIDDLEKTTDKSYETLHKTIQQLQEDQRRDLSEIRKELRYLNNRIDAAITVKGE